MADTLTMTAPHAPLDSSSLVYLVDASGYIFRAYHALPDMSRSDGTPTKAVYGFCNMLWKFLAEVKGGDKPTHIGIVFDKSEKTFRKDLYPEYKAHRPPAPDDLVPQFPLTREAARAFGLAVVEMEGFEADDLIATYARRAARAGAKVRIISSDKDLMQLVEDGIIHLHDPMKQKDIGPAEVQEKFGVGPDKVIDVQALMGDSTDNVPGAPGIGQKTAAELIGIYGSVEELIARAAEIKQPKRRETIQNNADKIRISKELVTLKDDVDTPDSVESFAVTEFDPATLLGFVDHMEFRTLAKRVREYLARQGATPLASTAPASKPAEIQIAEAAHEPAIDFDAYETVSTLEALNKWIARARSAGTVGIDVATDCQIPSRAKLVGLSLALGANEACYIPLAHKAKTNTSATGDLFGDAAPLRPAARATSPASRGGSNSARASHRRAEAAAGRTQRSEDRRQHQGRHQRADQARRARVAL